MRLKLAIQKSGRLNQDSMQLLKECGIDISNGINQLKAEASNFPIEVFFLRDDDIPQYSSLITIALQVYDMPKGVHLQNLTVCRLKFVTHSVDTPDQSNLILFLHSRS